MKGALFFLGTWMRWPAQDTKDFLYFHLYIASLYGLTFLVRSSSLNASCFIFTIGAISPLMYAIYKGLPLDCLNYESAISREFASIEQN